MVGLAGASEPHGRAALRERLWQVVLGASGHREAGEREICSFAQSAGAQGSRSGRRKAGPQRLSSGSRLLGYRGGNAPNLLFSSGPLAGAGLLGTKPAGRRRRPERAPRDSRPKDADWTIRTPLDSALESGTMSPGGDGIGWSRLGPLESSRVVPLSSLSKTS